MQPPTPAMPTPAADGAAPPPRDFAAKSPANTPNVIRKMTTMTIAHFAFVAESANKGFGRRNAKLAA